MEQKDKNYCSQLGYKARRHVANLSGTSVYRKNIYGNKTISIVFINASFNRFRMKILWIQETYIS